MRTLVLGLGNPIISDDGIGIQVARELKDKIEQQDVAVEETSMGGLNLLDLLVNIERAIIVDAIQTVGGEPGQIYKLGPAAFDATRHAATPHDVNFATALELGRRLGLTLPKRIDIFAIEVGDDRFRLKPGDSLFAPRMIPHAWAHISNQPGTLITLVSPAGTFETFIRDAARLPSVPTTEEVDKAFADHGMKVVGPPLTFD